MTISTVAFWHASRQFDNDAEVLGAYRLAHQQALDGAGESHQAWMGLDDDMYNDWRRDGVTPRLIMNKRTEKTKLIRRSNSVPRGWLALLESS